MTPTPVPARMRILPHTYRGDQGFLVTGSDGHGHSISIFTNTRESAVHIRNKKKAGMATVTKDFAAKPAAHAIVNKPYNGQRYDFMMRTDDPRFADAEVKHVTDVPDWTPPRVRSHGSIAFGENGVKYMVYGDWSVEPR